MGQSEFNKKYVDRFQVCGNELLIRRSEQKIFFDHRTALMAQVLNALLLKIVTWPVKTDDSKNCGIDFIMDAGLDGMFM